MKFWAKNVSFPDMLFFFSTKRFKHVQLDRSRKVTAEGFFHQVLIVERESYEKIFPKK